MFKRSVNVANRGGLKLTVKELIEELEKIEDKYLEVHVTEMGIGEFYTHESCEVEFDETQKKVFVW